MREIAGRASARLLPLSGSPPGGTPPERALLGIALPERAVSAVLGIDDFALRRSPDYATVLIDADTGARIDVIPKRGAEPRPSAGLRSTGRASDCWSAPAG